MADEAKQSYPCEVCGDPGYRHCASCRQVSYCRCVHVQSRLDPGSVLASGCTYTALTVRCDSRDSPDHEHKHWLSDHQFKCSLAMTELGTSCLVPLLALPCANKSRELRASQGPTQFRLVSVRPSNCASYVRVACC